MEKLCALGAPRSIPAAQVPSSPVVDMPSTSQLASSPVVDALSTSQLPSSPVVERHILLSHPPTQLQKLMFLQDIYLYYYYPIHIERLYQREDVMDLSYLRQKHQISQVLPLHVRPLHLNGVVAIRIRLLRRH